MVGEARPSGNVNPTSRTLTLAPGQRKQIALRMDDAFKGKFSVKALNPKPWRPTAIWRLKPTYTE